jgi:hypothetical protein
MKTDLISCRTLLLYPLCPFYAVFGHVLATVDHKDLSLMEEVSEGLTMFAEFNMAVGKIKTTCEILVSLCKVHFKDQADLRRTSR